VYLQQSTQASLDLPGAVGLCAAALVCYYEKKYPSLLGIHLMMLSAARMRTSARVLAALL